MDYSRIFCLPLPGEALDTVFCQSSPYCGRLSQDGSLPLWDAAGDGQELQSPRNRLPFPTLRPSRKLFLSNLWVGCSGNRMCNCRWPQRVPAPRPSQERPLDALRSPTSWAHPWTCDHALAEVGILLHAPASGRCLRSALRLQWERTGAGPGPLWVCHFTSVTVVSMGDPDWLPRRPGRWKDKHWLLGQAKLMSGSHQLHAMLWAHMELLGLSVTLWSFGKKGKFFERQI